MTSHHFSGYDWSVLAPDNSVHETRSPSALGAYSAVCVGRLHMHPRLVAHVRDNGLVHIYVMRTENYKSKKPHPSLEPVRPHVKKGFTRDEQIKYLIERTLDQRSRAIGDGSAKFRRIETYTQLDDDTLGRIFTSAYLENEKLEKPKPPEQQLLFEMHAYPD